MSRDVRRVLLSQALRAFGYGFAAVLLGVSLDQWGWSGTQAGLLLTAVVAGTAVTTLLVGTFGDRFGRRRTYLFLYLALAASGATFGLTDRFWVLSLVALAGALSTEVVESGPFTSVEQAILPSGLSASERPRIFGVYNAIATLAGSAGALAAGGPALLRRAWSDVPADERFFLVLVPIGIVGAMTALSLSEGIEVRQAGKNQGIPLGKSRGNVLRLSALFAMDSLGGGLVVQSFIAYWFRAKFDVSTEVIATLFFAVGILQSVSFMAATRIAERIGLLNTMVFTHLPSNLLLAAIPLAPTLPLAISLLLGRFALSQMDVPARQAYIVSLVAPEERTAAVAYTNSARYLVRPAGPSLAGAGQQLALGLPFMIGGGLKFVYDVLLWSWFRRVPLHPDEAAAAPEEKVKL